MESRKDVCKEHNVEPPVQEEMVQLSRTELENMIKNAVNTALSEPRAKRFKEDLDEEEGDEKGQICFFWPIS